MNQIQKRQLFFHPAGPEHAEILFRWRNQKDSLRFNPLMPLDVEGLEKFLRDRCGTLDELSQHISFRYMVDWDGRFIGSVSVSEINLRFGNAEIGYQVNEEFASQGLGTQMVGEWVDKLFAETELRKISAIIAKENVGSRRLVEKLGFVQEGILRDHFLIQDKWHDEVIYSVMKKEWPGFSEFNL